MPQMSTADRAKARDLIARLQDDDVQTKLRAGWERNFSNSVISQWEGDDWLSEAQLETLEDLVRRHEPRTARGGPSRRYEGFGR